jgi:hypothetical protein
MEWNLIFDSKGTLLKAAHFPAYEIRALPHSVQVLEIEDVAPATKRLDPGVPLLAQHDALHR